MYRTINVTFTLLDKTLLNIHETIEHYHTSRFKGVHEIGLLAKPKREWKQNEKIR